RRDVQPEAARRRSIETQRGVHLKEVKVRPHLHRTVTRVGNIQRHDLQINVGSDRGRVGWNDFTRNHGIADCGFRIADWVDGKNGFLSWRAVDVRSEWAWVSQSAFRNPQSAIHSPYRLMHGHEFRAVGKG